jgi:hypothetical protein
MLVYDLVFHTVLGYAANFLIRWLVGDGPSQKYNGIPLWSFVSAVVWQLAIFPSVCFLCTQQAGGVAAFLNGSVNTNADVSLQTAMVMLISYLTVHTLMGACDTLGNLHHIAGALTTILMLWFPRVLPHYMLGCVAMELANGPMNLFAVTSGHLREKMLVLYLLGFTVAHMFVCYLGYLVFMSDGNGLAVCVLLPQTAALVPMRQMDAIASYVQFDPERGSK